MRMDDLLTTALIGMRITGVLLAMPILSAGPIPPVLRGFFALAFAALLQPFIGSVPATVWNSNEAMLLLTARELGLGLLMGFSVRIIFMAFSLALEVAGLQIGFSMASILDPINNAEVSVLSQIGVVLMVLVFFGMNLHHEVFRTLVHSFAVVPIGLPTYDLGASVERLGQMLAESMQIGMRLAMPAMGIMLLIHVILGIIARAAPQMNLFFNVTFVVNIVVGILVLMMSLPRFIPAMVNFTRASAKHGLGLW